VEKDEIDNSDRVFGVTEVIQPCSIPWSNVMSDITSQSWTLHQVDEFEEKKSSFTLEE
jgi:hypothetical protein